MTKKKRVKKIDLPYTEICAKCATKMGAKNIPGHCCTVWTGQCPYCHKTTGMSGTNDWLWPDTGKPRGFWD